MSKREVDRPRSQSRSRSPSPDDAKNRQRDIPDFVLPPRIDQLPYVGAERTILEAKRGGLNIGDVFWDSRTRDGHRRGTDYHEQHLINWQNAARGGNLRVNVDGVDTDIVLFEDARVDELLNQREDDWNRQAAEIIQFAVPHYGFEDEDGNTEYAGSEVTDEAIEEVRHLGDWNEFGMRGNLGRYMRNPQRQQDNLGHDSKVRDTVLQSQKKLFPGRRETMRERDIRLALRDAKIVARAMRPLESRKELKRLRRGPRPRPRRERSRSPTKHSSSKREVRSRSPSPSPERKQPERKHHHHHHSSSK